jgi:hypothetical protein
MVKMGNIWSGVETSMMTGETDQDVTVVPPPIAGGRGPVAIRLSPIPGCGLQKRGPDSLPGMAIATDEHLGRGYADFFLLLVEERGLVSQRTLEG